MAQNNALNKSSEDFTVDNLFLDGNTLSSTDTNGNIFLTADGTGGVVVATDLTVGNTVQDTSFTINGAATKSVITLEATNSSSLDGFVTHRHSDTAGFGGHTVALRTRGSHATPTIVQDDDVLSINAVAGFDGTDYALAAQINVEVDGAPGLNDMPGRIVFKTSPDGTQTPTTALTITQDQGVTAAAYIDVDNLRLDGNTISTTDASGQLTLSPDSQAATNINSNVITQSVSSAGGTVYVNIGNTENTNAGSHAALLLKSGGTSAGDPYIRWSIEGQNSFHMGQDNSDGDFMKLGYGGNNPSDTLVSWQMTLFGERTMPLQPAFLGILSASDNNVTGNGTSYTLGSGNALTEVFDQNNDFVTSGTFTAPVTGRYKLGTTLRFNSITGNTATSLYINTSNRNYQYLTTATGTTTTTINKSTFADMDAADVSTISGSVTGLGADTADVVATSNQTIFFGHLEC